VSGSDGKPEFRSVLRRRSFLAAAPAVVLAGRAEAKESYGSFIASVRAQALSQGLSASVVDRALALARVPNAKVMQLDRHQPEFTLTWAQYKSRVLGAQRIASGREAFAARSALLDRIGSRFGVDPRVIVGIWGLESGFGKHIGTYAVVDALATLAYDARRAAFFRSELMKSLQILNAGDVAPERMLGSYAGAMGQPQFMPSAYLRYAVDFDGDGRRDIWTSEPDVFASVANYLSRSGWQAGEPWGQQVTLTRDLPPGTVGRTIRRSLAQWMALGVRRSDGGVFSRPDAEGAVLQPDGPGTEAFMVYRNFDAIRRYNPSDYYALGVGLLGYDVA